MTLRFKMGSGVNHFKVLVINGVLKKGKRGGGGGDFWLDGRSGDGQIRSQHTVRKAQLFMSGDAKRTSAWVRLLTNRTSIGGIVMTPVYPAAGVSVPCRSTQYTLFLTSICQPFSCSYETRSLSPCLLKRICFSKGLASGFNYQSLSPVVVDDCHALGRLLCAAVHVLAAKCEWWGGLEIVYLCLCPQ